METKRSISIGAEEVLDLYFPVLDYGFVSLQDYMGNDESIEKMARVSYSGGGTRKTSLTRTLLRYLRRHKHTSPYEGVELKFHVSMPIFVARQWFRHRTSSANEISGRYSLLPMLFYTPKQEHFSLQNKANNQGRGLTADEQLYKAATDRWNVLRKDSSQFYEDLVLSDIAREIARIDLPQSTYTQFFWKVNLHNLFHFLALRCDDHAQLEIRQFGNVLGGITKKIVPLSFEAWYDYNFCGESFSRMEMDLLRQLIYTGKDQQGNTLIGANMEQSIYIENSSNLSSREIKELYNKFQSKTFPNFDLDLSQAKDGKYFEDIMSAAVPGADVVKPVIENSNKPPP